MKLINKHTIALFTAFLFTSSAYAVSPVEVDFPFEREVLAEQEVASQTTSTETITVKKAGESTNSN